MGRVDLGGRPPSPPLNRMCPSKAPGSSRCGAVPHTIHCLAVTRWVVRCPRRDSGVGPTTRRPVRSSSKARVVATLASRHSWWATSMVRPYRAGRPFRLTARRPPGLLPHHPAPFPRPPWPSPRRRAPVPQPLSQSSRLHAPLRRRATARRPRLSASRTRASAARGHKPRPVSGCAALTSPLARRPRPRARSPARRPLPGST